MKSLIIYPSLAIMLIAGSCKSQKESSATAETKPTPVKPATPPPAATSPSAINAAGAHDEVVMPDGEKQANMYRFIVSFISIGEGTDRTGRETMDGVLASWEKKKGGSIAFEAVPWGREGEADFCFNLKELTSNEQEMFISDMKTAFKGRSLVQMSENQPCTHKR